MNTDKDYLVTQNKSFCVLPWIHIYVDPSGKPSPCCISTYAYDDTLTVNSKTNSLIELVNAPHMKQLRVDMMNGVLHPSCKLCHQSEVRGANSPRYSANSQHADRIDISTTKPDGELVDFKMRYLDVRFSNICNFKCRTCGPGFSSMWEQEEHRYNPTIPIKPKNNRDEFVQEVVDQVANLDVAYFAGGEPLITEEHYILLEEMIRQNRTDIFLRYNTNLSNLNFKDKDLLGLWKHFKNDVYVYASIVHYGDRAEYIRHGTDWGKIESNFLAVRDSPGVQLQTNTVLSIFNCMTIYEFYQYMYDRNLFRRDDRSNSIYTLLGPDCFDANILPIIYKGRAIENLQKLITLTESIGADCPFPGRVADKVKVLTDALSWYIPDSSTWEQHKELFKSETFRIDKIRGESFVKTFPELAGLLDE